MKKKLLCFIILTVAIAFIGCKHHHSNNNTPPISNPANYTYNISKIAEYHPGFFSICYYKKTGSRSFSFSIDL